jgi:tetratricopeptide (TPR) repeat protein
MGKHWAREQIRHDEVHDTVDKAMSWIQENRQTAGTAAAVVVVVALVAAVVARQRFSSRAAAWDRLSVAQSLAYSGRADASLEQLKQLETEQSGSAAAAFGELFAGDVLYERGDYKSAVEHYNKLLERGTPKALQPLALNGLALSQESLGQPQQAVASAQRFLEAYGDHYLAPQAHACLARSLQAMGQADQAKAAYQKISLQYPDTSFAALAQAQLKGSEKKK